MRDFNTKIDNDNTSAGVVVADEYNSNFSELKGAVTPFMGLSEADNKQLAKSIDIASKAMFYTDTGAPNAVILERGATTETLETLFDGMVVMFTPANANTGATTLKIKTLDAKPLYFDGAVLTAGFLAISNNYLAIYDVSNNRFNCSLLVNSKNLNDAISGISGFLTVQNFMHIQDQKPSGTTGGSAVAGKQTRVLNTILENTIIGASLSSNQIVLPAGEYFIEAYSTAGRINSNKLFIQNITDGVTELYGNSGLTQSTPDITVPVFINGKLSVASLKTFELQHYANFAYATYGLGYATGQGIEVYSDIKIWKVG